MNMIEYFFRFNLRDGKIIENEYEIDNDMLGVDCVKYFKTEKGPMAEIGDGIRHELILEAKYWNSILKIIRDDELDEDGKDAILKGLMKAYLPEEYVGNLVSAIKEGKIKEL